MGSENLEWALDVSAPRRRAEAFLALLASEQWTSALSPEVLNRQGYLTNEGMVPDLTLARRAAGHIAGDEAKVQRLLELVEDPFSSAVLEALCRTMGPALLPLALPHLRTAVGERAVTLMTAVHRADLSWLEQRGAARVVRRLLSSGELYRHRVLELLAEAGQVGPYLDLLLDPPPATMEEWSALGRGGLSSPELVNAALASFVDGPDALAYLLRLDPLPRGLIIRVMAAARPDWMMEAFEVAILEKLETTALLPLVELAVRLGGRPMGLATAWLGSARLSKELLIHLAALCREGGGTPGRAVPPDRLWLERQIPSADRALEAGRQGKAPDPMDAAALVRQVRGEDLLGLVQEILETPHPALMEPVLRPLCSLQREVAALVVELFQLDDRRLTPWIQKAMAWPDVFWPAAL